MSKLNVLISAYACEPLKGSEPEIGFSWAMELSKSTNLTVVTRANNKRSIKKFINNNIPAPHFIYYDLPSIFILLKKYKFLSTRIYYLLWQYQVKRKIEALFKNKDFDIYHHLTFSVDYLPSFPIGDKKKNCKYLIGPIGGYHTDNKIKKFIPMRYIALDLFFLYIRKFCLFFKKIEMKHYDAVLINNSFLAKDYSFTNKFEFISTQVTDPYLDNKLLTKKKSSFKPTKIIFGGRFKYWKGVHVIFDVIKKLSKINNFEFEFIIYSNISNSYHNKIYQFIVDNDLQANVRIQNLTKRNIFHEEVAKSDLFLYPTFYGTADCVMLESVQLNTPIVCFPSPGAEELFGKEYIFMTKKFCVDELVNLIVNYKRYLNKFYIQRNEILHLHNKDNKIKKILSLYKDLSAK